MGYYGRMRFPAVFLLVALSCAAQQPFYPFAVDQDRLSGAPDFSFMNQPITAKDRVVILNDKFVRAADGSPVRFFGVNLAFGANFPETAGRRADRQTAAPAGRQSGAPAPHG